MVQTIGSDSRSLHTISDSWKKYLSLTKFIESRTDKQIICSEIYEPYHGQFIDVFINKIIPDGPNTVTDHIANNIIGLYYYFHNYIPTAIEYFDLALNQSPSCTITLLNLGTLYYTENQIEHAVSFFQRGVQLGDSYCAYKLGTHYYRNISVRKAFNYLNVALEQNNLYAYDFMGDYYLSKQDFSRSHEYCKKTLNKFNAPIPIVHKLYAHYTKIDVNLYKSYNICLWGCQLMDLQFMAIAGAVELTYFYDLNLAIRMVENGDIFIHENLGVVRNLLGNLHYHNANTKQAVKCWSLAFNSSYPDAGYNLGYYYEQKNDLTKSTIYYAQSSKLGSLYAIMKMAHIHYKNENYQMAIVNSMKAYNMGCQCSIFNVGKIHQSQNNINEAIRYWKIGADTHRDQNCALELGDYYLKIDDFEQSFKYLKIIVEPDHIVLFNLGLCTFNLSQYEKALDYYLKSYRIVPNPKVHSNIGITYLEIGNLTLGLEYLTRAHQLGYSSAVINIGDAYLKLGNYEKAKEYLETSIELGLTGAHDKMGILYIKLKDYENAIKYLTTAVKLKSTTALYNMGVVYEKMGKTSLMIKYLDKGVDNGCVASCFRLGEYYFTGKHDITNAIHYFTIGANKKCVRCMFRLGDIYGYYQKKSSYALKYYQMGSNLKCARCTYWLAKYYECVLKKYFNALQAYSKIINEIDKMVIIEGNIESYKAHSYYSIGEIYEIHLYDDVKAQQYYKLAGELEHSKGLSKIGEYYLKNTDVEEQKKAKEYFEKSLELGYTNAYYHLGSYYQDVEQDYEKAFDNYLQSAHTLTMLSLTKIGILIKNYFPNNNSMIEQVIKSLVPSHTNSVIKFINDLECDSDMKNFIRMTIINMPKK